MRTPIDRATLRLLAGYVRPQWRIITDAIDCYVRGRSDAERRMVDELVGRARARSARARKI